jgi:hypothetical protein
MQESREEQKVTIAENDMQNTKIDTQNGTIEALRALSEKNVRKPTYSQVAQTGTIPPNEARKETVSSSSKESLVSQSARHDERAVSIGTDRAKFGSYQLQRNQGKAPARYRQSRGPERT